MTQKKCKKITTRRFAVTEDDSVYRSTKTYTDLPPPMETRKKKTERLVQERPLRCIENELTRKPSVEKPRVLSSMLTTTIMKKRNRVKGSARSRSIRKVRIWLSKQQKWNQKYGDCESPEEIERMQIPVILNPVDEVISGESSEKNDTKAK